MSNNGKTHFNISPVASSVPYDDLLVSPALNSDTVQTAIDALKNRVTASASPGFTWGRSGNIPNNTWLLNDSVPSNLSGRTIALNNAVITQVMIANEDPDIFTLSIYWHEGDSINLTLIGTVTTAALRTNFFTTNFAVPFGKQVALKISAGSGKNMVVGLQLFGNI